MHELIQGSHPAPLFPVSSHHRLVSPPESAGYGGGEELAGDSRQHPDDDRGRIQDALPGAGEEEGKAGGGGLRIREAERHTGQGGADSGCLGRGLARAMGLLCPSGISPLLAPCIRDALLGGLFCGVSV